MWNHCFLEVRQTESSAETRTHILLIRSQSLLLDVWYHVQASYLGWIPALSHHSREPNPMLVGFGTAITYHPESYPPPFPSGLYSTTL